MSSNGTYSITVQISGALESGQQISQLANTMNQVDTSIKGLTGVMNSFGSTLQGIASKIHSVIRHRAIVISLRLVGDSPRTRTTNRNPMVSGTFLNSYRPVLVVAMVSVFAMAFLIIGLVAFGLGLILIYVRSK